MKEKNYVKLVYAALFAALVFVGTQFVRVPLPFGYFNLGDCFILLSAVFIGGPYAVAASAVGAVLADVLSGYVIYAPATALIKSAMVLAVILAMRIGARNTEAKRNWVFLSGAVIAELIMVCGYFLYDSVLYHFAGAVAALPGNIAQGAVAVLASSIIVAVTKRR